MLYEHVSVILAANFVSKVCDIKCMNFANFSLISGDVISSFTSSWKMKSLLLLQIWPETSTPRNSMPTFDWVVNSLVSDCRQLRDDSVHLKSPSSPTQDKYVNLLLGRGVDVEIWKGVKLCAPVSDNWKFTSRAKVCCWLFVKIIISFIFTQKMKRYRNTWNLNKLAHWLLHRVLSCSMLSL